MIYKRLREIRKAKGMSQEKMAEILCTDPSNYSSKERGEIGIRKEEWEKIAKALEVSVDDLIEKDYKSSVINNISDDVIQHSNVLNSIITHLQDYISFLKEDRKRLLEENKTLHEQIKIIKP